MTSRPIARAWAEAHAAALVLRALVLVSAPLAVGCTWAAAHRVVPGVGVLVVALAGVCAWRPDGHVGLLVVLIVSAHWLAAVHDPATPWALGAAGALATFHASLAAAGLAPRSAAWTRAMARRWARRTLVLIATSAVAWALVALLHGRHTPGNGAVLVAALLLAAVTGVWARGAST